MHAVIGTKEARLAPAHLPRSAGLTPRETEVLELICEGLSDAGISARCRITAPTVKYYVRIIYSKLGVSRRSEAIVYAIQAGLVTPKWLADGWVKRPCATPA